MAEKKTTLSIVLRTVDKATAKLKAINDRIDAVTKPIRDFKEQLADLRERSGLDAVSDGFKGVGSAVVGVLAKVAMIGGVIGAAVAGLFSLVDGFDDLGDKAEAAGVSVDFLAQMRYAAERTGSSVEELDAGVQGLSTSLGQARAGSGKMASFLAKVSPVLLKQVKAAKGNEEAFNLIANAASKIEDPAKRAAFAQKTLGSAALAPLLGKGAKGIQELRDRYFELAGSQQGAVDAAGGVDESMKDLKASTDGIKAALVQGLSPALVQIVEELRAFFSENRERIAEWAKDLGKKLPGAIHKFVDGFLNAIDSVQSFVESIGGLKTVGIALAALIVGPMVSAVYALGVALLTTPVGWIIGGMVAIGAATYLLMDNWAAVSSFFTEVWDTITGKFGWARTLIKTLLWPIIGLPGLIVASWGDITDFFGELWGGITTVFQKAWEIISGIVDKVRDAVDFIKEALASNASADAFAAAARGGVSRPSWLGGGDLSNQVNGIAAGRSSSTEAKVIVDFQNAPTGTRVRTDPKSTADVATNVGSQMRFAP